MSDSFLLHVEDMLKDNHFPVIGFFSEISGEGRFIRIIDILAGGVGRGLNYAGCTFPDDVEVESEKFGDGVEFYLHNGDAVVLSYEELYRYMKKAGENYVKMYQSGGDAIAAILEKMRKRYGISE